MSRNVFMGQFDLGVCTPLNVEALRFGDFPWPLIFTAITYHVPTPKPISPFFQIIRPFDNIVWIFCLLSIILFGMMSIVASKFHVLTYAQPGSQNIKEKKLIDHFVYPVAFMIEPLLGNFWITSLASGTKSGLLLIFSLVIGGFFITTFYKSLLLAHLTAIGYEKSPENINGKNILIHTIH